MASCGEVRAVPDALCNRLKNRVFVSFCPGASKPERLTQVHLTDLGVGKDFFRSARGDHRTLVDDVCPGADPQRFAHIMVSDQDPDTALRELADDALDVEYRQRVDPGE